MNPYIRNSYHFLVSNPRNCDFINSESLLECLWLCHTAGHSIEETVILDKFESLDTCWASLSRKRQQILACTVAKLCLEFEHSGFLAGVRSGAQVVLELTQDSKNE